MIIYASYEAQRPPVEVADFCLPLGGLLSSLGPTQTTSPGIHDAAHRFSDGMPSYADSSYNHNRDLILKVHTDKAYHSYKRYSNDCFVFVLDDKTVKTTKNEPCVENDEHVASPGSRLYGICVQQARKLSVPVCTIANALSSSADMDDIQRALDVCSTDRDDVESPRSFAFESKVCFTIISRFPLFDFFFEIIQQVIHLDEEDRWKEAMTGRRRKNTESYVPIGLLNEVIGRLIKVRAPHYGASISFNVRLGRSMTVNGHRFSPSAHSKVSMDGGEMAPTVTSSEPGTDCEHHHMSAVWSLSVLLSPVALSVELLVRVLGLMLCEAKLVILGADLCLVSAIIMGLQTLIQPLEWVAPAISILPSKLTEFVECPVPLLAGLIVKPTGTKTFCPAPIQMSRSVANSPCAASSNQPSKSFHFSPVKVEIPDSMGQREASGSSTTLQAACLRASKLLKRCGETMNSRDGSEPGMLSAVLDTDEKELFLCGRCTPEMSRELVMPCAQLLVDRIKACLSESASGPQRHSSSEKTYHGKVEKMAQGEEEKRIISKVRSIIADHIRWVISLCIGGDVDRRVADAELKFTSINLQRACAARAAHASTFEEVMSVAMDECNGEPGEKIISRCSFDIICKS